MSETKPQFAQWTKLGNSGLKISNVIIGCMQYGCKGWLSWVEDNEETIFEILKIAYDKGLRTYDIADVYSNGLSEVILGKFLKKYNIKRDKVVIMTKGHFPIDDDYGPGFSVLRDLSPQQEIDFVNSRGLSRKHLFDAIDGSLRRLGVDYVDVYQIHRLDDTPKIEIMKTLNDLVESGKVRYIGASAMRAVDFVELQCIADKYNWHKFVNVQSKYNLLLREDENELNYYAKTHGVGITPYSPLARGILAKPVKENAEETCDFSERELSEVGTAFMKRPIARGNADQEADIAIIDRVGEVAKKRNTKRAVVALAWLIHKGASPICGVGKVERIDDLIEASNFELSEEEAKYLEEPYKPKARDFF